jgi:CBS domain-containing protein
MRVRDYMTTSVTTLNQDDRLLDAALLIRRTGKRHVPVLGPDGAVVGIVTDRDVNRLAPSMLSHMTAEEYNSVFEATPITLAMSKDPITVSPETPMREAVSLLYTKKIGALPVVEGGRLVGILTVSDMLRLLNEVLATRPRGAGSAGQGKS